MRKTVIRYIGGIFASLFLVLAVSAAQPSPVCALGECSSGKTVLKCDNGYCCTVTKKTSKICDCDKV